jgi:hypothetical protein
MTAKWLFCKADGILEFTIKPPKLDLEKMIEVGGSRTHRAPDGYLEVTESQSRAICLGKVHSLGDGQLRSGNRK